MDNKGYYKVLNLNPGATEKEVDRAFKRLLFDIHPDGGRIVKKVKQMPDGPEKEKKLKELDEKIKKANEAKEVLGNPEKKKLYDQGVDPNSQHMDMGDFSDIFSFMGGRSSRNQQKKVKDTEFQFDMTLKDVFLGRTKNFLVKRRIICVTCLGKGAKETTICKKCQGKGEYTTRRQVGFMFSIDTQNCDSCNGKGNLIKGPPCFDCKGSRYSEKKEQISVEFKKGFSDGECLVVKGKGDEETGAVTGDLILIAHVKKDPNFRRINNHLILKSSFDILTAITGGTISVKHIDDTILNVKIEPLKNLRDDVIVIFNAGLPGGHLYIEPSFPVQNIDVQKIKNISVPKKIPAGILKKGSISKLPSERQKEKSERGSSFKESFYSQFFSGF